MSSKTEQVKVKLEEKGKTLIKRGRMKRCEDQSNGKEILLLLAAQVIKNKIRPVLDFRELYRHVESHLGVDGTACTETLRKWR